MNKTRTTPFRANDAAATNREEAIHFYTRGLKEAKDREEAAAYIDSLIENYGPVVKGYPSWHPFTSNPLDKDLHHFEPHSVPRGFEGLDHSIYFRDAFLTAPYGGADRVIESVTSKGSKYLRAEQVRDVPLYYDKTTPVLVICDGLDKESDGTIAKRYALGLMLSEELPAWDRATCGESWERMRRYILGAPCGSRSSLFVNQDTGQALREVFNLLNRHELFGPVGC